MRPCWQPPGTGLAATAGPRAAGRAGAAGSGAVGGVPPRHAGPVRPLLEVADAAVLGEAQDPQVAVLVRLVALVPDLRAHDRGVPLDGHRLRGHAERHVVVPEAADVRQPA